jgi:hypothetical protein
MFIPDPKTATKMKGEKSCCPTFFGATNITKLKIILFLTGEEKTLGQLQRIFTQNIVIKLSKIWVWDLGSGIRDPGSGKNLESLPNEWKGPTCRPGPRIDPAAPRQPGTLPPGTPQSPRSPSCKLKRTKK